MSAQSASGTTSTANLFANADRTVLLPGSPRTYENRAVLRGLGLRWDPVGHRWHGSFPAPVVRRLRAELGLEVRCFGILEPSRRPEPPGLSEPAGPGPVRPAVPASVRAWDPAPRLRGDSRTRAEARTFYRVEEEPPATRRFSLLDITSGLPDDSREADERAAERRLADLRGRVKAARAAITAVPGGKDTFAGDWRKAAVFYARWGVTEAQFRHGVLGSESGAERDLAEVMESRADWISEVRAREVATLPESDRVKRG